MNVSDSVNLFDVDRPQLASFLRDSGEKAVFANHLFKWLHTQGNICVADLPNASTSLRAWLQAHAVITIPTVASERCAADGTMKWLLQLIDGKCIETVFIPETHRGTLCVSSQVGCALKCDFCATGKQGFQRNLSTAEIVSQVWFAVRRLSSCRGEHDHKITNVVLMGMGEPLLNLDNVVRAMNVMMDDFAYGLSKHRVTLSTSGLVPAMKKLAEQSDVALAVSLHAPNDELRDHLVPINKKYPLAELMTVCREYFPKEKKRKVVFEYTMLSGVNDTEQHAHELGKLLQGMSCKVNLIPFNSFPGTHYHSSDKKTIERFRHILMHEYCIIVNVRKTRGDDIAAACGQLANTGS